MRCSSCAHDWSLSNLGIAGGGGGNEFAGAVLPLELRMVSHNVARPTKWSLWGGGKLQVPSAASRSLGN